MFDATGVLWPQWLQLHISYHHYLVCVWCGWVYVCLCVWMGICVFCVWMGMCVWMGTCVCVCVCLCVCVCVFVFVLHKKCFVNWWLHLSEVDCHKFTFLLLKLEVLPKLGDILHVLLFSYAYKYMYYSCRLPLRQLHNDFRVSSCVKYCMLVALNEVTL